MSQAIATVFDATVRDLNNAGSLTHDDLLKLYPRNTTTVSVPSLDHVQFYADFACDPATANAQYQREREEAERVHGKEHVDKILRTNKHHPWRKHRQFDYRLTNDETMRLQQHGLMVSERLGAESFASVYYRLYTDDLPVFVTSDSILHAWHRSFDAMLADLEVQELMPLLASTLSKALAACATEIDTLPAGSTTRWSLFDWPCLMGCGSSDNTLESSALEPYDMTLTGAKAALAEVELFLGVAQQLLLNGKNETPPPPARQHSWGWDRQQKLDAELEASLGKATQLRVPANTHRLATLIEMVHREKLSTAMILGSPRDVDFSLFKPRGHYTKSAHLQRYFRAMTWLGTIDFRVDGGDDATDAFQLQCACMLVHILRQANVLHQIQTVHKTIAAFAGDGVGSDSMTPMQLHELIGHQNVLSVYFGDHAYHNLRRLQDEIANRGLGTQAIGGHPAIETVQSGPSRSPTAFTLLGQQFVWSAFIFSKVVFDQVSHDGKKVPRRMASGVDVAFALFGNDAASDVIATRMAATGGKCDEYAKFRDGLPYATNLIAARQVVDRALSKVGPKNCSVAQLWQLALRELSPSSTNPATTFKSAAWRKRVMNTQLASFTQLRHDTILYAKQSCGMVSMCEYPAGYVDPYPSFWHKMHKLANRTLAIVKTLQGTNQDARKPTTDVVSKAHRCLTNFADVTYKLYRIATAQAKHQALSTAQVTFLQTVMEERRGSGGSRYLGWYPGLFYTEREDSGKRDHLVADVFTDPSCSQHGDPGGILHMGVGNVNLAMVVVDETLYAGPVFSHYEFVTSINQRLTDDEFSKCLPTLAPPQWATESFLATRPSPFG